MKVYKKIICAFLAAVCAVTAAGCSTAQPLETKVSLQPLETEAPTQPTETEDPTQSTETSAATQPPATETTQPDGTVSKVIFSEKLLRVAQMEPQAWVDDLIATSDGQYEDVYVNEDGVSVTLEITEEQREYWKASRAGYIDVLQDKFTEINPSYRIDVSNDYSHIDFYFNLDLDAHSVAYNVLYAEVFCVCMQLFNGVGAEDWYVSVNVYNSDTEKLVKSGDSETGLAWEAEDWERSYSEE